MMNLFTFPSDPVTVVYDLWFVSLYLPVSAHSSLFSSTLIPS